jgi:hypothetical protein
MSKMKYNPLTGNLDMVSSSEAQQHPWIFGMAIRTDEETIESYDHLDLLYNNNEITITICSALETETPGIISVDIYANDEKILSRDKLPLYAASVDYSVPVTRDVITFRMVGRVNGVETVKELTVQRKLPVLIDYTRAASENPQRTSRIMSFGGRIQYIPPLEYKPQLELTYYKNHGGKFHLHVPEDITFRMMTSNGIAIPMTHTIDDSVVIGGEVCRYNVYSSDTIDPNSLIIQNIKVIYEQN